MSVRKHLEQFAQNTSMHGFGKIILTKKPEKRAAWVIVFFSAWALFAYQLSSVLSKYFEYSKKTTTEFVSGGAPFPAITLCNMQSIDFYAIHKFLKSEADSKDSSKEGSLDANNSFAYHFHLLNDLSRKYLKRNDATQSDRNDLQDINSRTIFAANFPTSVKNEVATKQHEFVVKCAYGKSKSCNFTEIPDPYYLRCFTFEPPHVRNTSFEDLQSLSEGILNGFSVTLFTGIKSSENNVSEKQFGLPGVYDIESPLSGSSGIRVVIHPPGTEPFPLTEGYDVPPGYQVSLGIVPERRKRLGKPYGLCANRNIYKSKSLEELNGFETDHNENYRKISCERMCMQQQVIKECKCIDETLPGQEKTYCDYNFCWRVDKDGKQSNDTLRLNQDMPIRTCRGIEFLEECALDVNCNASIVAETIQDIRCADDVIERLMTDLSSLSKCNCHAPCDEFRYYVSYSLAKWPSSGYEGASVYDEIFRQKNFTDRFAGGKKIMYEEYKNRLGMESLNDFAKINVYIADSNVLQIIEEPATTITQLISEIGGQLGIWIGVSVITISEVLEALLKIAKAGFKRLCCKSQPKITDADDETKTEQNVG